MFPRKPYDKRTRNLQDLNHLVFELDARVIDLERKVESLEFYKQVALDWLLKIQNELDSKGA